VLDADNWPRGIANAAVCIRANVFWHLRHDSRGIRPPAISSVEHMPLNVGGKGREECRQADIKEWRNKFKLNAIKLECAFPPTTLGHKCSERTIRVLEPTIQWMGIRRNSFSDQMEEISWPQRIDRIDCRYKIWMEKFNRFEFELPRNRIFPKK
jgi:hypothetical protein